MAEQPILSPGEWAVLALLCEQKSHGWPLVTALSPDGEIGRVWTVRRAVVYRSLDLLQARGLIEPAGDMPSARGPRRTVMRPTRRGRAAIRRWLDQPVLHVRDIRSLLILKLVFGERSRRDQRGMLARQLELLRGFEQTFAERLATATGSDRMLLRFRLETTRAAERFVEELL